MNSSTILLAAQNSADSSPSWIPVLAALTSAGIATIIVNVVKGVWVSRQERGPRARVQAIRDGAETLALLVPGSTAYRAVENHVLDEAVALSMPARSFWDFGVHYSFSDEVDVNSQSTPSVGPFGTSYQSWTRTFEKRRRVVKTIARVALVISILALAATVLSFFAPWTLALHISVAAIGGVIFAVALSVGLMLPRALRAVTGFTIHGGDATFTSGDVRPEEVIEDDPDQHRA